MTPLFLIIIILAALSAGHSAQGLPIHTRNARFYRRFMEFFDLSLHDDENVCHTDACLDSARNLMASIDESVDPCDDFYAFACNGWIKNHPIPPMAISWSQFNVLNEKLDARLRKLLSRGVKDDDEDMVKAIKMIYESCMKEEAIEGRGLQPLFDLLDELNGWPLISTRAYNRKLHWQNTVMLVSKKVGITPILDVGVDVDLRNTSRNTIVVEQPSASTPASSFADPGYNQEYAAYVSRVVQMMRRKKNIPPFPYEVLRQIRFMIQFQKALSTLTKRKEEMRVLEKFHNPVTIKELQDWTDNAITYTQSPRMNWKKYIQGLLEKDDTEINDETPVVVSDWEFLRGLFRLIDSSLPETIVNFILWEVVMTLGRATNKKMRTMEFEFKRDMWGVTEDIPRWQECVHATDDVAFAVGYLYVKNYFGDESKAKAINIVENIRQVFRKELSEVTWIDEETKASALEKADYMNHFIGYPNWYENETALNEYYKGLKIGRNHFENVLAVRQFLTRKYLKEWDKKTSRDEWATGPAIINAYYDPRTNSIIFPAGILESPFFNKDQPDALNYGSIGSIIGHEITHAFDDVGRQGDKFGNIHQWWTKETEDTYLRNAKCFVDEYRQFRFPSLDNMTTDELRLNGILTLSENIADNGGVATALKAYLKHSHGKNIKLPGLEHYTSDQLFYLGFATMWCETTSETSLLDEILEGSHSPHSVRVQGTLYNSDHFSRTWGCSRGSKMNPPKKCRLW